MRARVLTVAVAVALIAPAPVSGQSGTSGCPDPATIAVPGAEYVQATCLDDLTTLGNPRTDTGATTGAGTRANGSIHSNLSDLPDQPVPGLQIEGWFPDSCDHVALETTTFIPACPGGFRHNGQFVIRIPDDWDGEHLVVAGTPGVRTQFASDILISDFVLARGWAYASQDKGNTGLNFFRAGDDETGGSRTRWLPGRAIEQWAGFMQLTALAAEDVLAEHYGGVPSLTYATGISNGGHQTRLALERYPEVFDGGVDWEGTLLQAAAPNLFTYLPPALAAYPAYQAGESEAYDAIVHGGRMPPDSEPIWPNHWSIYWGLVQSTYRPVFDPEYTDYVAAPREVVPPDPDASYDYAARPAEVAQRIDAVANTGEISERPLLTLHGTLDALLPIDTDSDVYAEMVRDSGNGESFRYYVVENGTHVDKLQESYPDLFQPILPCYLGALDALDAWVTDGEAPPPSGFVPFAVERTPQERANACDLPASADRVAGEDRVDTALAASRGTFGITSTVVLAAAGSFADALAAAPLAAAVGGPVLLVDGELDEGLRTELRRTGALEAVIVGGTAAVPARVEDALLAEGLTVRRVAGSDRYATAAEIAGEVAADDDTTDEVILASGEAFADALSVAPIAAAARTPVLLTRAGALPDVTAAALQRLDPARTLVVGGTEAVSEEVLARLPAPRRVAGPTRYETSAAVARLAVARGHSPEVVGVATGRGFADALAAGPVMAAGYGGAPGAGVLLLVDGTVRSGSSAARDFLVEHGAAVQGVVVFGGPAAVSDAVVSGLDPGDATDDVGAAPGGGPAPETLGTSFPDGFAVPTDASLGVPVLGFGADGPVERTPVVFLHGNNDTAYPTDCNARFGRIHDLAASLLDHGYATSELWGLSYQGDQCDLPAAPTNRSGEAHSTVANVPDLRAFVAAVLDYTGAEQVDLVGHSLGATLSRAWMAEDDAYDVVRRLVAIDGPHHGIVNCSPSPANYWQQPALGGFTPDSAICREYGAADTPLLAALNAGDETPGPTGYLAVANSDTSFVFFDRQDGLIPPVPAEDRTGAPHDFSRSALLDGAQTLLVEGQGVHDDTLATAHLGILASPEVWGAVADFLLGP